MIRVSSHTQAIRRKGDAVIRARVQSLLDTGEAAWCDVIRLELWNGAGGDQEKKVLRDFEKVLPELVIDETVWLAAYDLARRARVAGVSIPATDLLIAACARHHEVELEHSDSDFAQLSRIK